MNAEIDISTTRLETGRLILRPWRETDLEDFYAYARVDGVGQMAGWLPHESIEQTKTILDSFIAHKKTFALELKENGKVIGSLGIEKADDLDFPNDWLCREIGYALSKDYWGRGLMPEAVQAVMDYCFRELGLDYLICGHFDSNGQSRRVIEKCGFRYLTTQKYQTQMGKERTVLLYAAFPKGRSVLSKLEEACCGLRLETARLVLRNFSDGDSNDCFAFLSDRESCYLDMGREPFSTQNGEYLWLMDRFSKQKSRFVVELKDEHKVIGTVNCWEIDRAVPSAEIGFVISPEYRRSGYAYEALRELIDFLFVSVGLEIVTASAVAHNDASIALLNKLGFTYEGYSRKGFFCPDRGAVDLNCFYLEKENV